MKHIKYYIMVVLILFLTACNLPNLTEKQKVIDYLSKSEDYKKVDDSYVLNLEGDLYSNMSYYYEEHHNFALEKINIYNFEYEYLAESYYDNDDNSYTIIRTNYIYNPNTNISQGTYKVNTFYPGEAAPRYHNEYSYLYNYNYGTSECSYKKGLVSKSEDCAINSEYFGRQFLKHRDGFISLLKVAKVSQKKFFEELEE